MSLFPAWTELDRIQTVTDAVNWFRVDATVWNLWLAQVGDPQDDLRLLAALPSACGRPLNVGLPELKSSEYTNPLATVPTCSENFQDLPIFNNGYFVGGSSRQRL